MTLFHRMCEDIQKAFILFCVPLFRCPKEINIAWTNHILIFCVNEMVSGWPFENWPYMCQCMKLVQKRIFWTDLKKCIYPGVSKVLLCLNYLWILPRWWKLKLCNVGFFSVAFWWHVLRLLLFSQPSCAC